MVLTIDRDFFEVNLQSIAHKDGSKTKQFILPNAGIKRIEFSRTRFFVNMKEQKRKVKKYRHEIIYGQIFLVFILKDHKKL